MPDFKAKPRKNDIAILIGIENYQSLPKADFSKNDALLLKNYLKALGFQDRNIELIIDEKATFDAKSTGMINDLVKKLNQLEPEDWTEATAAYKIVR